MNQKILPDLISLKPDAIAEEIAQWLAEKLDDDGRAYGVIGPMGTQVMAFLKDGDVIVIDVSLGEVTIR